MGSIVEALRARAAAHPDRLAIACAEQHISYGDLWSRVVTAACHLSDQGVQPGQRVLLVAPSSPAFAYGYLACHLLGAVAVMLDPHAPAARREELVRRTAPALEFGPHRPLEELESLPARQGHFGGPAPRDLADLMFTTGTTGRPKGVPLTHAAIAAAAAHINAVIGTRDGDVEVVPIPLYHSFGLGRLRCALSAGAAVVLVQGFRLPGEIFAALERHRATGLAGVPAGFAVLLRFGERGLGSFADRLRYVEIGSAPMPLDHKRLLMSLLPRTSLFMHYGLTEASRSAFIEFHRDEARLHTVGRPAPGVHIEARDEAGGGCAPGTPGMLWISGPHVARAYWDDAELSEATFRDGAVRSGDVGHVDEEGFIHLHGRLDDMVNVGGFNVAPDEVERALAEHPAVQEAGCVGMPDPRGISGQVLRAFLVRRGSCVALSDADLSRWIAQRLEPYKVPARYDWVEALPRTASGKLLRAALRKQADK
jgi:long-chain acyl-CoA synthetase